MSGVSQPEPSPTAATTDQLDRKSLLALLEASRVVNEQLDPDQACRLVAEQAAAVLGAEGASVLLLDASRDELVFQVVVGPASTSIKPGERFPSDRGIAGQVIRTLRAVRVADVHQNRNFYPGIDVKSKTTTRDLMAAPLVHAGTVLGVIEVLNHQGSEGFTRRDLDLLEVFANLVAVAARNAQAFDQLHRANRGLRESIPQAQFIGQSRAFDRVLELCHRVAPTGTTVLLDGETGTGKEMAARAIHAFSGRSESPFVAVNCAALPESLIESELFGHEAGAFTGATTERLGRFELASGGTLLLDEIGELEAAMQSKLLRVLEAREFTRVGGTRTITCDVRVVAATNRDLKREVEAGRFREDLYYRLNVFPITLPPLRARIEDLPILVEHLIAQVAPSLGRSAPAVSDETLTCLRRYRWPGNVRELRNVIERAALLADEEIRPEHLPPEVARATPDETGNDATADGDGPSSALAEQEMRLVVEALEQNDWNQSAAARHLGITRDILRYRVKRYGLRRPG